MTTLQFLSSIADWLLADPSHLVTAASIVAAVTPTPPAGTLAARLYQVIDILALNVLHAKDGNAKGAGGAGAMVAPILAALSLSACAISGVPWTPSQTAFVELKIATAAQTSAATVIAVPGLSPADIADIKAGSAAFSAGVQAQIAGLTGGGTVEQQAVSGVVSAIASAVSDLGGILTAKHGATVDPSVPLLVAGESALQTLPGVIAAVVQVNGGWQPQASDLAQATVDFNSATAKVAGAGS